jgi:carbonic anhydrase
VLKMLFTLLGLMASSSLSADNEGMNRLIKGNERYVQDKLEHPNRTLERRQAIVSTQEPFATIVGCADSRVSPEIVFDQGVGDLFVVRVAGNVIGPLELDSIDYSVIYLHSSVVIVLGHENCGAVNAVIQGTVQDIESVAELIEPAVVAAKKTNPSNLLEASIKANARRMRDYLLQTPVVRKYVEEKKLEVYAGYYHLESGVVEILRP